MLYSRNREAQGLYDEAARVLVDYIYDIFGLENLVEESPMYIRLEYLYPSCSENLKAEIDEISQSLN